MRRFILVRRQDVSGISGTGVVAEGVEFSDGTAAVRWLGRYPSTVAWQGGVPHIRGTHGHEGRTIIRWLDPDPVEVLAPKEP